MSSILFASTVGIILAMGLVSTRMSFESKNAQMVRQLNSIEGFYSADLAATNAYYLGRIPTGENSDKHAISDSVWQQLIRRYRPGMLKRFVEGNKFCAEARFSGKAEAYRTCIFTASMIPIPQPIPGIVTSGLVLNLDATQPATGTSNLCSLQTWKDLSSSGLIGNLVSVSTACQNNSGWNGENVPLDPRRLEFDGINDHVSLSTNSAFSLGTGDFTLEGWIRTSSSSTSNYFLSQRSVCNQNQNFWNVLTTSDGKIYVELDDSSNSVGYWGVKGTTSVNDGQWKHVSVVRSGTTIRIYVNGKQEATSVTYNSAGWQSGGAIGNTNLASAYPLHIGKSACGNFSGGIANVAIYSRALSESEIDQNCNGKKDRFAGVVCQ